MTGAAHQGFGWGHIVRLGLVQASIGAIVMLATSLLNRVMVVEYGLAAAIPAGLVAWHYAVQLTRPLWGQGSDQGRERSPWILFGMAVLGLGSLLAVNATMLIAGHRPLGILLAILGFTMIGAGVGAAGTSLLALLASGVAPKRRAAAAATTWIMMIAGIVITAGTAGALLDPFSPRRLALVASGVVATALLLTIVALFRLERRALPASASATKDQVPDMRAALAEIAGEPTARRFTGFIFVSMLAYSMQDLILEPFAGLVFAMSPGQSTQLSGIQHGGILVGMIVAGIGGSAFTGRLPGELRNWIAAGCLGSALALAGLAFGARAGPGWPLVPNVFVLGFFNGVFTVAAIGAMMGLAGSGERTREGVRMGVWGAAQAIAFGLGGLTGALGLDLARQIMANDAAAFQLVFSFEGGLFVAAGWLAFKASRGQTVRRVKAIGS